MSATHISLDEYLHTSYRSDCDYVDGEVLERNWGDYNHARLHGQVMYFLHTQEKQHGIEVVPSLRIRVSPSRIRIADICAILGNPGEQILTKPPLLCVEILSPEDTFFRMEARVDDYLAMGVAYVWVLDPKTKRAWSITPAEGWREEKSGILQTENPALEIPLSEIFA
jgi:Uma2 family endonuclease